MSDRDAIIAKIRKLAQFTEANGCTEAEARLAASHLANLLLTHNITEEEVRREAAACLQDYFCEVEERPQEWTMHVAKIATLFSCKAWFTRDCEDLGGIYIDTLRWNFFGSPADVAACISMATIICQSINLEAAKQPKRNRPAFRQGMSDRFGEMLHAMIPTQRAAQGQSLIVLKDQLVTEEWAKHCREHDIRLRQARVKESPRNGDAYREGYATAGGIKLRPDTSIASTSHLALPSH